jgi:citrate synthase
MRQCVKPWVNSYCNLDVQKSMGYPLNYYDNTKGYVENFMRLMFELPTGPYINPVVDALDKLFILHADHEQNCSTSTVRMVGSSHGIICFYLSRSFSTLGTFARWSEPSHWKC